MAIIPSGQKFHTVSSGVDTNDKGSARSNADRDIYTMQDVLDTVGSNRPAGVNSLENLTGDLNLVGAGTVTVTDNGSDTITITGTGGGSSSDSVIINFAFFDSIVRDVYIPVVGETENTAPQRYNRFVIPFNGSVTKIFLVPLGNNYSGGTGGQLSIGRGSATPTIVETQTFASANIGQTVELTYTNSNFAAGDVLTFYLRNGFPLAFSNMMGTILIEKT